MTRETSRIIGVVVGILVVLAVLAISTVVIWFKCWWFFKLHPNAPWWSWFIGD